MNELTIEGFDENDFRLMKRLIGSYMMPVDSPDFELALKLLSKIKQVVKALDETPE